MLEVSYDTSVYEVPAELDDEGRLTLTCTEKARNTLDKHGFVIIPELLSSEEADCGLRLVRQAIDDPNRSRGTFASETDIRYVRRDFCSLPATESTLSYAAMLSRRLGCLLTEYCGTSRPVLEISTLTSYLGSSHQYIHRDPFGAICLFAAVDDVTPEQGGTVFVPGTHTYGGAEMQFDGKAYQLMDLYKILCNIHILRHNLNRLWKMRGTGQPPLAPREFRDRVFSRRHDDHQPNLLRFALGKSYQFNLLMLGPRTLWRMLRNRKIIKEAFQLIQTTPRKGTVILYRSDVMHAGPDNRSVSPRYFFSMSIARDVMHPGQWALAYSPHATLIAAPRTLGDLLGD